MHSVCCLDANKALSFTSCLIAILATRLMLYFTYTTRCHALTNTYIHTYIHTYIQYTYICVYVCIHMYTVDGERFVGLNICSFSATEVVAEIFLHFLGHKQYISTHYLVQLKRGIYIHGKTFVVLLKTVKNGKD